MRTLRHPHEIAKSGDYARDCAAGRDLWNAYLADAAANKCHLGIHHALLSMMGEGRKSGVEVAFIQAIAHAACSSDSALREISC